MASSINTQAESPGWKLLIRNYVLLTFGGILMAVNINLFLAPSGIAPGGVTGISIILNQMTGWLVGTTMLVLNLPMLALGFVQLGRFRFLIRSLYVVLIFNLGTDLLAPWLRAGVTDDLLLNALYGGVLGGIATGIVFRGSATAAGTSVISRVIQLKTGIPNSQIYMFIDGSVILVLGLVFGWRNALYSLITLFIWGLATDYVLEGPSVVRMAFVVTDAPEAVSCALLERLRVGVTSWPAEGMFTHRPHTTLFCTISRPDVPLLKSVVQEIDPAAFIVIGQGHQSTGGMLGRLKRQAARRCTQDTGGSEGFPP